MGIDTKSRSDTGSRILADALHVEIDRIPQDASIATTENWDSMAHMRLILGIEEHLKRQLAPHEVAQISSLEDVRRLVER